VGWLVTVKMAFAGCASHHHRAREHETRPKTAYDGNEFLHVSAEAGQEILIDQKIRLDRADAVFALDDQVAVLEAILQRVFEKFVISMVLSLLSERRLPMR